MRKPESCSESRMRSRTSRGVPEWSGGKDLYMGSPVLVTGKVSGEIGNVPGPPGGSRGSTKWGHQPQKAAWAKCGRGPAPGGLVRPPTKAQGALGGERGNPRRRWAFRPTLGRAPSLPLLAAPSKSHLGLAAPLGVGNPKGGAAPLPPIYT